MEFFGNQCPALPAFFTTTTGKLSFQSAGRSPLPESATISLVDDETALVHAIGEFLRESGFPVDAFSSQDAIDLAKEYPGRIDVLVTDVDMPGLRGPDLHSQIVEFQPEIRLSRGPSGYEIALRCALSAEPFRFIALLESLGQLQTGN
jgi:CheY-like chemotaxis protein